MVIRNRRHPKTDQKCLDVLSLVFSKRKSAPALLKSWVAATSSRVSGNGTGQHPCSFDENEVFFPNYQVVLLTPMPHIEEPWEVLHSYAHAGEAPAETHRGIKRRVVGKNGPKSFAWNSLNILNRLCKSSGVKHLNQILKRFCWLSIAPLQRASWYQHRGAETLNSFTKEFVSAKGNWHSLR